MKKQRLVASSILAMSLIVTLGCNKNQPSAKESPKVSTTPTVSTSAPTTLATLKSSGVSTLSLKGTKAYKENQAISFTVNTMGKAGYLYIIYLDNKGETQILYPNSRSPLTELSGEYVFPRDFGNMTINASKDCNGCSEDKTTIYAILTKEPVIDIKDITKAHLLKFAGMKSNAQGKGINFDEGSESVENSNVNIGRIEFIVN